MESTTCLHIIGANESSFQTLVKIATRQRWRSKVYESAEGFLSRYRPTDIECLLIDLDLPGMNGLQLIKEIRRRYWSVPIIATHPWPATHVVVEAMQSGAGDFLEQPFESEAVQVKVVRSLAGDETTKLLLRDRTSRLATLSAREREVLELLLSASTTICIANRLEISPKTVEKHRTNVMTKLNVNSVPELMKLWLQCAPGALPAAPVCPTSDSPAVIDCSIAAHS